MTQFGKNVRSETQPVSGPPTLPVIGSWICEPISQRLEMIFDRVVARAEVFVSGRYWLLEVLLVAVLFSVLFSGGIDNRLWEINNNYSNGYYLKIKHPLANVADYFPPEKHDAKLNFRLTVPVLLHLLGVGPEEHWVLPALPVLAFCASSTNSWLT